MPMVNFLDSEDGPEIRWLHFEMKPLTLLSFLHSHSEYVRAEVSPRVPCPYSLEIGIVFTWIERELH